VDLRTLGVASDKIALTADPVLALEPAAADRVDTLLARARIDPGRGPAIGVAIRPWPTWYERLFKAFSAVLAQVAAREDAQIILLPFQRPHDDRITWELHDCLGLRPRGHAPGVTMLDAPLTPAETMGVLSRCELVVGMRLHALIMAAAGGVPFVGIAYDPKVEQFAAAWDMPAIPGMAALEDSHRIEDLVTRGWVDRHESGRIVRTLLGEQRGRARLNFELARRTAGLSGELQWAVAASDPASPFSKPDEPDPHPNETPPS
jgi:polysaccharide pyruvyl transferase WcaK-like protein